MSGKVGVKHDFVIEAVADGIILVVPPKRLPVLKQFCRRQNEDIVVSKLKILDDRQRFEGFPQPDTVGDDATAVVMEFL